MPLTRPAGVYVSGYTYTSKENCWGTAANFLLDQNSGRTDVVLFGEKNFYRSDYRSPDSLGGAGDALAKAILATGRTLYATPVYMGSDNQPFRAEEPQYQAALRTDNWQDVTQPNGHNCSLVGTRYCFDSLWYGKVNSTNEYYLPKPATSTITSTLTLDLNFFNAFTRFIPQILFVGSFNNFRPNFKTANTTGPYSIPTFENYYNYSYITDSIVKRVKIADVSNNRVTVVYYPTEVKTLHDQYVPAQFRPPTINVNDVASTLVSNNPNTLELAGTILYFKWTFTNFLKPLLLGLGWQINENPAVTIWSNPSFDVYKTTVTVDQATPQDAWLFKRQLPYNFEGASSFLAFGNASAMRLWANERITFNTTQQQNTIFNGRSNHTGLPNMVHYVPSLVEFSRGSVRTSIQAWEYGSASTSGGEPAVGNWTIANIHMNPATTSVAHAFYWNSNWDSVCDVFKKNKYIKCSTKVGKTIDYSNPAAPVLTTSTSRYSLYTTNSFKLKFLSYEASGLFGLGEVALTISEQTGANAPVLLNEELIPIGSNPPFGDYVLYSSNTVDLSSNTADYLYLSITGYNTAQATTRTNGSVYLPTWWGEDENNTNGISFSWGYLTEDFRGGDIIYALGGFLESQARLGLFQLFRSLWLRQANQNNKKLVIAFSSHRFDAATPGAAYLGGLSSIYSSNIKEIVVLAENAGFLEDEIVCIQVSPNLSGKVDNWSEDIADNFWNGTGSPLLTNNNALKNIYVSDTPSQNSIGGILTPRHPLSLQERLPNTPAIIPPEIASFASPSLNSPEFKRILFIDRAGLPTFVFNSISPTNEIDNYYNETYDSPGGAGAVYDFNSPSDLHNLESTYPIINALQTLESGVYFVPPWVPVYGRYLNIANDPVSNVPWVFTSISLDPLDIEPYLQSYYTLVSQSYDDATKILAYYKHKILQ